MMKWGMRPVMVLWAREERIAAFRWDGMGEGAGRLSDEAFIDWILLTWAKNRWRATGSGTRVGPAASNPRLDPDLARRPPPNHEAPSFWSRGKTPQQQQRRQQYTSMQQLGP